MLTVLKHSFVTVMQIESILWPAAGKEAYCNEKKADAKQEAKGEV
jgi:hypothetical protein